MSTEGYNKFEFEGPVSTVHAFVDTCCRGISADRLELDFNKIIPAPREPHASNRARDLWWFEHWGTPSIFDQKTLENTPTRVVLRFLTGGAPPEGIYREIARRFPEASLRARFVEGEHELAVSFEASGGELSSVERDATDDDWFVATGKTVEEAEREFEEAYQRVMASLPRRRVSRGVVHPKYWLNFYRVRRALEGYPLYDVPHKRAGLDLTEQQVQENFNYFMRVRMQRLAYLQSWLSKRFGVRAPLNPAGIEALNRWVNRFGGGVLGDESNGLAIFASYLEPWAGPFVGYNLAIDLGIFMGEYVIFRQPEISWDVYRGHPADKAASHSAGYLKPCLAGFPRQTTSDVIVHGYGCLADGRQARKLGAHPALRGSDLLISSVKSALHSARNKSFVRGDSNNEQL